MPRAILWIYALISVANITANLIPSEELNRFTKPLLMPLLLLYVYRKSVGNTTLKVLLLSGAILFSWFGDVALIYQSNKIYFILGIGLFLVAQIIYVVTLLKASFQKPTWKVTDFYPSIVIIYGGVLFYILLPAGEFTIPIIIYGLVILTMTIAAYLRKDVSSVESFRMALWGSILFVLSDSILAINSFKLPIQHSGVLIMSTYCLAQYFLAEGLLRHPD